MRVFPYISVSLLLSGCIVHDHVYGPPPLTSVDRVELHHAGRSEAYIVSLIYRNGMDRRPTVDEIVEWKKIGMSDAVIKAALEGPVRPVVYETRTVRYYDPYWIEGAAFIGAWSFWHPHAFWPYHHYRGCPW